MLMNAKAENPNPSAGIWAEGKSMTYWILLAGTCPRSFVHPFWLVNAYAILIFDIFNVIYGNIYNYKVTDNTSEVFTSLLLHMIA